MNIEMLPIGAVKEYDRNPRTINDAAIDAVAKSIQAFGFKIPILIDADGVIIAGHTRLRAARKLGLKKVPTIRADDLTPEQVKALRIADNKVATLTSWDMELLPIELADLKGVDFDLALLGFFTLTGKVNTGAFKGFQAGEVLFLGASGARRGTDPDDDWEITFRFAASPNASGLSVGDIGGISKKGWEYLWVRYADQEDTGSHAIVKRPVAAYIERVYDEGNFAGLGI